jgi:hypothetical protein
MRAQWLWVPVLGASVCLSAACAASRGAGSATTLAASSTDRAAALPVGVWAEYWAVNGGADTQRYLFLDGGRFAWRAPAQAAPNTVLQKSGTFSVEPKSGASVLVLSVTQERFAPCSAQCSQHDRGPRRVEHPTPIIERLEIGECAPNLEAQALDAHYACRALGGRTFWRRATPLAKDLADFAD